LFWRFVFVFMPVLLFFVAAFVFLLGFIFQPLREAFPHPGVLVALVCGLPLGFSVLAAVFGGLAFRRFSSPVADVMAAADAVAGGDLNVRVRENIPGEFGQLARSFNRMTAELANVEQQRRNLTADVAHELRTPLHIIQGNLEGILDGVYEPTDEHISATLEETRLLARLVSDLQTLSLAEAGQLPLHEEMLSAADLLEDTLTSFSGPAGAAGLEVRLEIPDPIPAEGLSVYGDPDRLEQVLNNLVANALRYTPPGGRITLGAQVIEGGVRLFVADTGAGIAAEDLPHIFDRFWKGDRTRARREGAGSGLGLAIARQLVQAHRGQIWAESQPGAGTTFFIELPHNASQDA
jgi:two-component system OmpR family sensor kinase/two-component system sensor histidine kinase BaeS